MTVSLIVAPSEVNPGDYVYVEMRLPLGTSGTGNYLFSVRPSADIFDDVGLQGREFGFIEAGPATIAATWLRVKSDATPQTVDLTFAGVNSRARGLSSPNNPLFPQGGVYSISVVAPVPAPVPRADGFNISFITTTSELRRGDFVYLIMSLRNPSDDAFEFRIADSGGAFDLPSPFILQGTEEIRMFLQAGETATERSGILEIESVNDAAMNLDSLLTANTYSYTVLPAVVPIVPSATDVVITFEPASGSRLVAGDYVHLTMSLPGATDGEFVFSLFDASNEFEMAQPITIQGREVLNTFFQVKANARLGSSQLIILGENLAARALERFFTDDARNTYDYTVIDPTPNAESVSIEFSPELSADITRGDYLYLKMSLEHASDDDFDFTIDFDPDTFIGEQSITISGSETIRTFLQVREDAALEFGRVSVSPTEDTARHITNLSSATDFTDFTIVPIPIAPTTDFNLDNIRQYFEEPFCESKFRLPSEEKWGEDKATRDASTNGPYVLNPNSNLVLTNARVLIAEKDFDGIITPGGFYQIPFVIGDGLPSEQYLKGVDTYPGACWVRLSIRDGASRQVSIGTRPKYRFTGVAFFQIFVKQNMSSKQARDIHTEISKYLLSWKSFRKQKGDYGNVSVQAPASTFGIDTDVNGWTQSNLNFPFTYDASI